MDAFVNCSFVILNNDADAIQEMEIAILPSFTRLLRFRDSISINLIIVNLHLYNEYFLFYIH